MLNMGDVFSNLAGLFLLIAVGYAAVKFQVLPASSTKLLSNLLMQVTLPATILTSLVRPYDAAFVRDGVLIAVLGAALFALYGLLALPASRLFRVPQGRRGVWIFSSMFSNNGFMGFPVALALFQEEGLALAVFLGIPFNLLAYTLGPKLMCMDHDAQDNTPPPSWRSILLTGVNCATVLGLVLYLCHLSIPSTLSAPLTYLSNVTTPLSMLVIGMNLTEGRVGDLLRDRDVFSVTFLRLILFPVLTWAILRLLPISSPLVVGVTLIIMAMPAPAISAILAESYHSDKELASRAVFLSSLLCLISIPLISLLL